jgi:predicted dehydrogenase
MGQTRRHFLHTGAGAGAGLALSPVALASAAQNQSAAGTRAQGSANDNIQIALIGAGGMGMGDLRYALSLPGIQVVAAADVYDGRLKRCRELWGDGLFTSRDYREVLARKDVDAVIVATPDHWHAQIATDAMNAGKDVYLEKPMIQRLEDGPPLIEAARKTGRILQVGSQYVSSIIYHKVRDLIGSGAIGTLNMVEAVLDRNTAMGAWQYTIPPDASPQTVDWDRFQGRAPKRPFDAKRVFRWRNYQDYGTGVAGDLFVHLLSGIHVATNSLGPVRAYATGGLRYWDDGRDVPDVMLALYDYGKTESHPAFNLALRVNFKSSVPQERFEFRFVGSEGIIDAGSTVKLSKPPRETEPGAWVDTFARETQQEYMKSYRQQYPRREASADTMLPQQVEEFVPPPGYSAHLEHHRVFWSAVRSRKPVVEDAVFGMRAAGAALLSNLSYAGNRIVGWNPQAMQVKKSA